MEENIYELLNLYSSSKFLRVTLKINEIFPNFFKDIPLEELEIEKGKIFEAEKLDFDLDFLKQNQNHLKHSIYYILFLGISETRTDLFDFVLENYKELNNDKISDLFSFILIEQIPNYETNYFKIESSILKKCLELFPKCLDKIDDRHITCDFETAKILRFYGYSKKINLIPKLYFEDFKDFQEFVWDCRGELDLHNYVTTIINFIEQDVNTVDECDEGIIVLICICKDYVFGIEDFLKVFRFFFNHGKAGLLIKMINNNADKYDRKFLEALNSSLRQFQSQFLS